ncbi:MAG: hypothetical protein Q9166_007896 [cf. Caloplaca sp. 2 TL-2023]
MDDDTDALFASPSRPEMKTRSEPSHSDCEDANTQQFRKSDNGDFDSEEGRESALRKELAGIRNINQVIEGAVDSLQRAQGNMNTEHNQCLILNPSWHGATQDMADIENESLLKHQEKERRELEDLQRREAHARKAEEDERKKSENVGVKSSRGAIGSGRGTSRKGSSTQMAPPAGSVTSGRTVDSRVARAGSAIGRGYRGRSRGP